MSESKPHILIVDDEPDFARMMSIMLSSYRVSIAPDAETGLKIAREDTPDTILLDIMLPDVDGLTWLSRVQPLFPDTPVIILTAYSNTERAVKALRYGAYDFLQKPVKSADLLNVTRRAVAHRARMRRRTEYLAQLERRYRELLLRSHQVDAQEKLSMLDQLSRGISHEINNPISVIRLNTEMIALTDDLSKELRERLGHIQEATARIEETINSLRLLSLPQEKPMQVSVREVVDDCVGALRSLEQFGRCQVSIAIPPDLPAILIAPTQLRRAVYSILLNAVEAGTSSDDPVRRFINIEALKMDESVRITVRTPGTSIPAADLPNVFRPDYTTKIVEGRMRGLGLGLFIARIIASANGGTLGVQSIEGQGVIVHLTIPIKPSPLAGEKPARAG